MENNAGIYKWYLILAIIYSSISILTGITFFFPNTLVLAGLIWSPIVLIWFLTNIVMLIIVLVKKIKNYAFVLPSLYIFDMIFSLTVGIVIGLLSVFNETAPSAALYGPLPLALGLIFPIATLIIAIKLILKK